MARNPIKTYAADGDLTSVGNEEVVVTEAPAEEYIDAQTRAEMEAGAAALAKFASNAAAE